jgi:hypothetical protein
MHDHFFPMILGCIQELVSKPNLMTREAPSTNTLPGLSRLSLLFSSKAFRIFAQSDLEKIGISDRPEK